MHALIEMADMPGIKADELSRQAKMSPESRARSKAQADRLIQEMALDELRAARALTQEHLSTILGVKQSATSKLERRADMYVSTLRRWVQRYDTEGLAGLEALLEARLRG